MDRQTLSSTHCNYITTARQGQCCGTCLQAWRLANHKMSWIAKFVRSVQHSSRVGVSTGQAFAIGWDAGNKSCLEGRLCVDYLRSLCLLYPLQSRAAPATTTCTIRRRLRRHTTTFRNADSTMDLMLPATIWRKAGLLMLIVMEVSATRPFHAPHSKITGMDSAKAISRRSGATDAIDFSLQLRALAGPGSQSHFAVSLSA